MNFGIGTRLPLVVPGCSSSTGGFKEEHEKGQLRRCVEKSPGVPPNSGWIVKAEKSVNLRRRRGVCNEEGGSDCQKR